MKKKGGVFENFLEAISEQNPNIQAITIIIGKEPDKEIQESFLAFLEIIQGDEFSSAIRNHLKNTGRL